MKIDLFALGVVATAFVLHPTAFAQDTDAPEHEAEAMTDEPAKPCELHVWPTENYLGVKMGLLSGFGGIGAVADLAANKKGVTNVKTLMREYLGPEIQLAELEKLDYVTRLGLDPAQYRVVIQSPTPCNEDLKDNPELKAAGKATNNKIKADERISDSTNPCYAELITTHEGLCGVGGEKVGHLSLTETRDREERRGSFPVAPCG